MAAIELVHGGPLLPLPEVPDPVDSICFQIQVPNDQTHISAFVGALINLSYWFNWDRDLAHTGAVAAARWKQALQTLSVCAKQTCASTGVSEELLIRQDPDNPCLLQSSIDGITWCTFADLSKCFNNLTQLGGGTPQPTPGGGNQEYCQGLQANNTLLLPTVVNAGDTLTLTKASGAGWDGASGTPWRCYDGEVFFAGACIGGQTTHGGDPLPTAPHMALIYDIGGTFYNAVAGPVTVPSGVVNAQVTLQVNNALIADAAGSYNICVTVTNNKAGAWSHPFDLSLSPHSDKFSIVTLGVWTAGQGYVFSTGLDGSEYYTGLGLQATWATPTTLTRVAYGFDMTVGTVSDPANGAIEVQLNTVLQPGYVPFSALISGANQNFNWSGSQTGVNNLFAFLAAAEGHSSPPTGGSGALKTITIAGVGFDPFA